MINARHLELIRLCGMGRAMARAWTHAIVVELVPDEPMTSRYARIVHGSLVTLSFFTEHFPSIRWLSLALEDAIRGVIDAVTVGREEWLERLELMLAFRGAPHPSNIFELKISQHQYFDY